MWNIKNKIEIIVAVRWIAPPDQTLVNIIDITDKIRIGLTSKFDLWNIGKNLRIGTEIDVLVGSFRLKNGED